MDQPADGAPQVAMQQGMGPQTPHLRRERGEDAMRNDMVVYWYTYTYTLVGG